MRQLAWTPKALRAFKHLVSRKMRDLVLVRIRAIIHIAGAKLSISMD
jgi:hypothetical protein